MIVRYRSLIPCPRLWNSLPPHVKSSSSVSIFKTRNKTFIFSHSSLIILTNSKVLCGAIDSVESDMVRDGRTMTIQSSLIWFEKVNQWLYSQAWYGLRWWINDHTVKSDMVWDGESITIHSSSSSSSSSVWSANQWTLITLHLRVHVVWFLEETLLLTLNTKCNIRTNNDVAPITSTSQSFPFLHTSTHKQ